MRTLNSRSRLLISHIFIPIIVFLTLTGCHGVKSSVISDDQVIDKFQVNDEAIQQTHDIKDQPEVHQPDGKSSDSEEHIDIIQLTKEEGIRRFDAEVEPDVDSIKYDDKIIRDQDHPEYSKDPDLYNQKRSVKRKLEPSIVEEEKIDDPIVDVEKNEEKEIQENVDDKKLLKSVDVIPDHNTPELIPVKVDQISDNIFLTNNEAARKSLIIDNEDEDKENEDEEIRNERSSDKEDDKKILDSQNSVQYWKEQALNLQKKLKNQTYLQHLREQAEILPGVPNYTENEYLDLFKKISPKKSLEKFYVDSLDTSLLNKKQIEVLRCAEGLLAEQQRQSFAENIFECIRGFNIFNCMRIFIWPIIVENLPERITQNLPSLPIEVTLSDWLPGGQETQKNTRATSVHQQRLISPELVISNILKEALESNLNDNNLPSYINAHNETLLKLLNSNQFEILEMAEKFLPESARQDYSSKMTSCIKRFEYFSCVKYFAWPMIKQHFPALPEFPDYQSWYPATISVYPGYPIIPFPEFSEENGKLPEIIEADIYRNRSPRPETLFAHILKNTLDQQPRQPFLSSATRLQDDMEYITPEQLSSIQMAEQLLPADQRPEFVKSTVKCMKQYDYLTCMKYSTWPAVRKWKPQLPNLSDFESFFSTFTLPTIPTFSPPHLPSWFPGAGIIGGSGSESGSGSVTIGGGSGGGTPSGGSGSVGGSGSGAGAGAGGGAGSGSGGGSGIQVIGGGSPGGQGGVQGGTQGSGSGAGTGGGSNNGGITIIIPPPQSSGGGQTGSGGSGQWSGSGSGSGTGGNQGGSQGGIQWGGSGGSQGGSQGGNQGGNQGGIQWGGSGTGGSQGSSPGGGQGSNQGGIQWGGSGSGGPQGGSQGGSQGGNQGGIQWGGSGGSQGGNQGGGQGGILGGIGGGIPGAIGGGIHWGGTGGQNGNQEGIGGGIQWGGSGSGGSQGGSQGGNQGGIQWGGSGGPQGGNQGGSQGGSQGGIQWGGSGGPQGGNQGGSQGGSQGGIQWGGSGGPQGGQGGSQGGSQGGIQWGGSGGPQGGQGGSQGGSQGGIQWGGSGGPQGGNQGGSQGGSQGGIQWGGSGSGGPQGGNQGGSQGGSQGGIQWGGSGSGGPQGGNQGGSQGGSQGGIQWGGSGSPQGGQGGSQGGSQGGIQWGGSGGPQGGNQGGSQGGSQGGIQWGGSGSNQGSSGVTQKPTTGSSTGQGSGSNGNGGSSITIIIHPGGSTQVSGDGTGQSTGSSGGNLGGSSNNQGSAGSGLHDSIGTSGHGGTGGIQIGSGGGTSGGQGSNIGSTGNNQGSGSGGISGSQGGSSGGIQIGGGGSGTGGQGSNIGGSGTNQGLGGGSTGGGQGSSNTQGGSGGIHIDGNQTGNTGSSSGSQGPSGGSIGGIIGGGKPGGSTDGGLGGITGGSSSGSNNSGGTGGIQIGGGDSGSIGGSGGNQGSIGGSGSDQGSIGGTTSGNQGSSGTGGSGGIGIISGGGPSGSIGGSSDTSSQCTCCPKSVAVTRESIANLKQLEPYIVNLLHNLRFSLINTPIQRPLLSDKQSLFQSRLNNDELAILGLAESLTPLTARRDLVSRALGCVQGGAEFMVCTKNVIWPFLKLYITNFPEFPNEQTVLASSQGRYRVSNRQPIFNHPFTSTSASFNNLYRYPNIQISGRTPIHSGISAKADDEPVISVTGNRFVPIFSDHPEGLILNILSTISKTMKPSDGSEFNSKLSEFISRFNSTLNEQQENILKIAESLLPASNRQSLYESMFECLGNNDFITCSRDVLWPKLSEFFSRLPNFPTFQRIENFNSEYIQPISDNITPISETDVKTDQHGNAMVTITDTRFVPILSDHPEELILKVLKSVDPLQQNSSPYSAIAKSPQFMSFTNQQADVILVAENLLPSPLRENFVTQMNSCARDSNFVDCMRDVAWPTIGQFVTKLPSFPNVGSLPSLPMSKLQPSPLLPPHLEPTYTEHPAGQFSFLPVGQYQVPQYFQPYHRNQQFSGAHQHDNLQTGIPSSNQYQRYPSLLVNQLKSY
ncbi:uncharacterized protein [Chelonus insularis]|uniref:uncharacterized protein isoform X5 n=1 Tax=Chelonus insularis TaxID=460826 RepID=UPI00158A20B2|nr:uncharacterized protein LOC118074474 isoform X5 [Chelonus insularis]